ncbi:MAG: hypothetical protein AAF726_06435 [Planctomycetota bacterium]
MKIALTALAALFATPTAFAQSTVEADLTGLVRNGSTPFPSGLFAGPLDGRTGRVRFDVAVPASSGSFNSATYDVSADTATVRVGYAGDGGAQPAGAFNVFESPAIGDLMTGQFALAESGVDVQIELVDITGTAWSGTDLSSLAGDYSTGSFLRAVVTVTDGVGSFIIDVGQLQIRSVRERIGTNYCGPSVINANGLRGTMRAYGSVVAADNDVTLVAADLTSFAFSFFIASRTQDFVPMVAGGRGTLCVGGSVSRFQSVGQIKNGMIVGSIDLEIDLVSVPSPTGLASIQAGETWNFQAWYRDPVPLSSTSNFTDGLSIVFQ